MKQIVFKETVYDVIDETPTHYICPPQRITEGYHYISKNLSETYTPRLVEQARELRGYFKAAIESYGPKRAVPVNIEMLKATTKLEFGAEEHKLFHAFLNILEGYAYPDLLEEQAELMLEHTSATISDMLEPLQETDWDQFEVCLAFNGKAVILPPSTSVYNGIISMLETIISDDVYRKEEG